MDVWDFKKKETVSTKNKMIINIKEHKELTVIFFVGLILIIFIYFLLTNISDNTKYNEKDYGNTNGNVNCGALAINKGAETYFYNISCDENIYTIKDRNKKSNLGVSGCCMSIYDNYLYYIDVKSDCIYKMDINNNEKQTKISNEKVEMFNIVNDWIYYIKNSEGSEICKMKIDGTKQKLICKDESENICIYKGWIYFINGSKEGYIYKIRTNGWNKKKVSKIKALSFDIEKDWLYYVPVTAFKEGQVRKAKLNGRKDNELFKIETFQINVEDGFIYCGNLDGLTKINLQSGKKSKLFDHYAEAISILDNWIYFVTLEKEEKEEKDNKNLLLGKIYRIKKDGQNLERIAVDNNK